MVENLSKIKHNGGFIKLIIILVIMLIVLGYFGFNVEKIIKSPMVSGNLNYVWDLTLDFWNNFLKGPIVFIWDKIIVEMFWNNLISITDKLKQ